MRSLEKWDDKPKLDFIDHYYTDKGYIQSLALSVVEHQEPLFSSLISSKVSKQSAEKPGQMTCICSTPSCAKVQAQGCEKIVVLPLYPQYSDTTTASTLDTINKALEKWDDKPKLDFIDHYYTDKGYIQSLALSVIEHQEQHGKPDKLMISFHGIPQRFVDNGDIYYEHCVNTSVLLAEALNLQDKKSNFGLSSHFSSALLIVSSVDAVVVSEYCG
jgi:ferrochelatase